ncbi:6095_t:CDS:2 [Funneliformis mosseae]|uniref:6095_t:CDS:1 n=1 Tax=Funneliformis mosseae TaxID=27381 RepID=A0A9N8Z0U9_FUNMO|nr:6095_t:CDS:2 [Funneliformis mosseae]
MKIKSLEDENQMLTTINKAFGKGKISVHANDEVEFDFDLNETEMKSILKTLPLELNLNLEETFTSETNTEICQKLLPELFKVLIDIYEEHQRGELSTYGEIHDALVQSDYSLYEKALRQTKVTEIDNEYMHQTEKEYNDYDDMLDN